MQPSSFGRHDWVWLVRDWHGHLCAPLTPDDYEAVYSWTRAVQPLVVGRSQPGDGAGCLRLGLALPGKRRIGVHIKKTAISVHRPPLVLTKTIFTAPPGWRPALAELSMELEKIGEEACVFGSLAWQFFASSPEFVYLTAASDIDLLFRPSTWNSIVRLTGALERFQYHHPAPRLDGEIVLPDGDAVAWREIANRPVKVLVKGMAGVRLRDLADIRSLFQEVMA